MFIQAARSGDFGTMENMLSAGFQINSHSETGETAFSWCCAEDNLASAKFLHERGADVNAKVADDCLPLDVAVCWASPEFRQWLRSVGGTRMHNWEEWPWPPPADRSNIGQRRSEYARKLAPLLRDVLREEG